MNRTMNRAASMLLLLSTAGSAMALDKQNDTEMLSYIFGLDIGRSLTQQGEEVNLEVLIEALRTGFAGETPELTPEQIDEFRNAFIARRQAEMQAAGQEAMATNKAAGQAFLAANRGKPGVEETASGLQYVVESEGEGGHPGATDSVTVHYRGTLIDGTEFDSSYSRNQPISFRLDQVIPGWTEGLQLMSPGGKFKFYIPSDLAYGDEGRPPTIPQAATLIFEVELLEFTSS